MTFCRSRSCTRMKGVIGGRSGVSTIQAHVFFTRRMTCECNITPAIVTSCEVFLSVKFLECKVIIKMITLEDIKAFSTEDICNSSLRKLPRSMHQQFQHLERIKLNGEVFLSLTDEEIKKEISYTLGERKSLLSLIASYKVKVLYLRYIYIYIYIYIY